MLLQYNNEHNILDKLSVLETLR
uniref:Uncharacterized protein n=1 Tax=Arundo donax TaxID=35708 RepID=A0A0A8ZGN1_ARUDO